MSLAQDLSLHNPVARAEHNHLLRAAPVQRPVRRRLFLAILYGIVVLGLLLVFFSLGHALFSIKTAAPHNLRSVAMGFFLFTVILHFSTLSGTLAIASATILREKFIGTWDTLILTDIDARQLVLGKWWAVVCMTWRRFAFLAVLRAAASMILGILIFSADNNYILWFDRQPAANPLFNIVFAALLMVAFTMINGLFTAAAGVMASFLGCTNVVIAQAVRMSVALLPVIILMVPVVYYLVKYMPPVDIDDIGPLPMIIVWIQITFLDNGFLHTTMMANPLDSTGWGFLLVGLLCLSFYGFLTVGMLRLGQFIAYKQGVSAS